MASSIGALEREEVAPEPAAIDAPRAPALTEVKVAPHEEAPAAPSHRKAKAAAGALGATVLLAFKFKGVLLFLATKAKFLLLGLTKWKTLVSMLLSMGVYWNAWGLPFAAGIVLSLYVHEMGHVQALRRAGIAASAPMFVPGLGAFVRLKQPPRTPTEDARVGLAGPVWGLGAATLAYAGYLAFEAPLLAAIAAAGAWLNLFNLLPFWQLDGGRAFSSMDRSQRWLVASMILAGWVITHEGLLLLLLLAAVVQAMRTAPEEGDARGALAYGAVLVALVAMSQIHVPGVA